MSRFSAILTLSLCAALFAIPAHADVTEGQPAPALTGKLIDGTAFNLAADRGQVVIINLWASWCSPCRTEMPAIERYYAAHKQEGLKVYAISMDDAKDDADVRTVMQKYSVPAAFHREVSMDGYGEIWRMPMTFIVDRQGILRKDGSVGEPKVDDAILNNIVTPLLAQPASKP